MYVFIVTLHVILCLFLVLIILMQPGKGGDVSSAFGGGASSQPFGAAGPGNFLTRGTGVIAALFMVTSISLALYGGGGSSVDDAVQQKIQEEEQEGSGFGASGAAPTATPEAAPTPAEPTAVPTQPSAPSEATPGLPESAPTAPAEAPPAPTQSAPAAPGGAAVPGGTP